MHWLPALEKETDVHISVISGDHLTHSFLTVFSNHDRENEASLAVLPDLLLELDRMDEVYGNLEFVLSSLKEIASVTKSTMSVAVN